jgi:hypothetical protein
MKRSIPPPTQAERDRWSLLGMLGCIVCRLRWKTRPFVSAEINHINEGGRNISHWHTIPLCAWHHRRVCYSNTTEKEMVRVFGHSIDHGRKLFEQDHGSERYLWTVVQRFFRLDRKWPASKIVPRVQLEGAA